MTGTTKPTDGAKTTVTVTKKGNGQVHDGTSDTYAEGDKIEGLPKETIDSLKAKGFVE